jgi:hypothetical protein
VQGDAVLAKTTSAPFPPPVSASLQHPTQLHPFDYLPKKEVDIFDDGFDFSKILKDSFLVFDDGSPRGRRGLLSRVQAG